MKKALLALALLPTYALAEMTEHNGRIYGSVGLTSLTTKTQTDKVKNQQGLNLAFGYEVNEALAFEYRNLSSKEKSSTLDGTDYKVSGSSNGLYVRLTNQIRLSDPIWEHVKFMNMYSVLGYNRVETSYRDDSNAERLEAKSSVSIGAGTELLIGKYVATYVEYVAYTKDISSINVGLKFTY